MKKSKQVFHCNTLECSVCKSNHRVTQCWTFTGIFLQGQQNILKDKAFCYICIWRSVALPSAQVTAVRKHIIHYYIPTEWITKSVIDMWKQLVMINQLNTRRQSVSQLNTVALTAAIRASTVNLNNLVSPIQLKKAHIGLCY